jgi:pimeloyl-ACP methyl ester carboxylesterase
MRKTRNSAALVLALLASLPAAAAEPPALSLRTIEVKAGDGTPVAAEAGELLVPENRAEPGSRKIALRFLRFKSTAAKPGSPIVYLAGGPGGSGIAAARGVRLPLFLALRQFGDVIALDQRGTGEKTELGCQEPIALDLAAPLDRAKAGAAAAAAARLCAERLKAQGVDLRGYNTRESAADLDELRRALGAEKLTLWGISYGTHLALATLRDFGQNIDRVILAGIEGPDDTYKLPSDQEELLRRIAVLARPQIADLEGTIRGLLAELAARPKSVELVDPMSGESGAIVLGPLDLQVVLAQMLGGPDLFAGLPDFVARLAAGDWTALALRAAAARFGEAPLAMTTAMDCASGITAARRARIAAEAPKTLLGDAINMPFPEICAGVEVADLGDAFRAPLESKVPALLISGSLDGRTRPRQAEALLAGMPSAVHLLIDGAGHSDPLFLSSPKILETMVKFLRGEKVEERRIQLAPVAFVPPRSVAAVPDAVLESYVGKYKIAEGSYRRVVKAGSVLYTIRDGSGPLPIRPLSATEFFYDDGGPASSLRFETDADGKVVAMIFRRPGGAEERCPRE